MTAPMISTASPASGSAGTTVWLTGSGFTGVSAVRFGSVPATSFTVVSPTVISATAPAGSGTVQITVTGPGGTSNALAFTYVGVPHLTSAVPNGGPTAGGTSVTVTGTGLSEVVTVTFGATSVAFTVVSDSVLVTTAPAGSGTVQITATSPGGSSNTLPYTYLPAPVVTAVTPDQGPTVGGTTVTVTGSGFTGATGVQFGSTPATFTVVSNTQIVAAAPPGAPGVVRVTVTTAGGTGSAFYYYLGTPVLTGVVPVEGPTSGGTTLTLTGSSLSEASAVRFGSVSATSFTVVSDTQVLATSPAGSGTEQITVTSPGGTSNGVAFTYAPAPHLTSAVPNEGPTAGGTLVTLTGTGLSEVATVTFGATPAPFTILSDTLLVATAPAGSGTVQITATAPGGTSNTLSYLQVAPPVL